MKRKVFGSIAALAVAATALVGCSSSGGGANADGSYDLTFWVYSDFTQGDAGELMNQLVEEFKAENENVGKVTLVPKNDADLLSGLMSGVGLPDAFSASARDAKSYRETIDLIDLSSVYTGDYANGFYEQALDAVTADGGVWAVPFISYIPVIYRNLDVLGKAGIDPSVGTPTYDVFLDQLAKIDEAGISATHSWTNNGYFPPGAVMASDAENITVGVEDGKTTIIPEELVRTFETTAKIEEFANSSMVYDADATLEAFKTGELGFLIGGPWNEPGFAESGVNYDFVLVPAYEEGGWTGGLQGWDFFYGVQSGDEGRDELVTAWLEKLGSYETQKQWTLTTGRATLREDVMDDANVIESTDMARISSEGLKAGMMQMEFLHSGVFWPSAMADPVAQLGSGALTPEEAAETFVDAINALYAEAGE